MKEFLLKTAWPMNPPVPYSLFHILFTALGLIAVVLLAYYTKRRINNQKLPILLSGCGIILAGAEIWKQLFLYYIVNGQTYNWWYFPFQLCSLPMYFCLLLPFIKRNSRKRKLYTFMQDFNLLGGVMALAEPTGLFQPYWMLTLHGLFWHLLLIYIGLIIAFSRCSDTTWKGFVETLPLFLFCCIVASVINRTARPLGQADMFYISPYYPSAQIVFHEIAVTYGIRAGNAVYLCATCLGGFIFHSIFNRIHLRSIRMAS
ncbi:YwaF family protein [Clostridium sp. HBUAS56010]|uniref:TMEM164 family acyltransferase n=1 Tax=Clostridium sp. HBUAS56010 TaxID=2571127 RepID=UPI0011784C3B|nr:YwaF family protein [Clostridium sp. HBUAS56010]